MELYSVVKERVNNNGMVTHIEYLDEFDNLDDAYAKANEHIKNHENNKPDFFMPGHWEFCISVEGAGEYGVYYIEQEEVLAWASRNAKNAEC